LRREHACESRLIRGVSMKVDLISASRFEARVGQRVADLANHEQIIEPLRAVRAAMRLKFSRSCCMALAAARVYGAMRPQSTLQHSGAFHSTLVGA
jgi:hypothetical protein